jgi:hypothetical protein
VTQLRTKQQRVLLRRDQVLDELQIEEDRLEELIDANLLTEIRVRGYRRFDSDEVDQIRFQGSTPRSRGGANSSLHSFRRCRANR